MPQSPHPSGVVIVRILMEVVPTCQHELARALRKRRRRVRNILPPILLLRHAHKNGQGMLTSPCPTLLLAVVETLRLAVLAANRSNQQAYSPRLLDAGPPG